MDAKELKLILGKRYTIDCPNMILSPQSQDSVLKRYEGSGFISQDEDGTFSLKMNCTSEISPDDVFSGFGKDAGRILGEECFCRLSAMDISGRKWDARWIFPTFNAGIGSGCEIQGRSRELSCSFRLSRPITGYYVSIYFPGDIQIPCNRAMQIEKLVNGEKHHQSSSLNMARFEACQMEFELEKEQDYLLFKASSKKQEINEALINRFMEALQFALARSLSRKIIEQFHHQTRKITIRSASENSIVSRIQPPIEFQSRGRADGVWNLFGRYLNHTMGCPETSWHPTFSWIHRVIESGTASIDTQGLVLSIAIEGVIKTEFSDLPLEDSSLRGQVEKAKELLVNSDLDKGFIERIKGSLAAMLNPRAKDILHFLKDQGLLEHSLIKSYDQLRNRQAHGERIESSKLQKHLDLCGAVLVLFYQLIFLAVGYTGEYADYSSYGFPTKKFDKQLNSKPPKKTQCPVHPEVAGKR